MHSTIKLVVFIYFLCNLNNAISQRINNDFAIWGWFQLDKKITPKKSMSFQYQVRFTENASRFNRSNLYFSMNQKISKKIRAELLYQLNTNYHNDQHTLYLGGTYKYKISSNFIIYGRTAFQHSRFSFSGDYRQDKPLTEWRNRIRLVVPIRTVFDIAISTEPYLILMNRYLYWSRIRYVSQLNFTYNKYQNFTLFFLYQPDLVYGNTIDRNYVIGFTNSISLPNKIKQLKKMYKPTFIKYLKERDNSKISEDTYN